MATITIRNLDEKVKRALQIRAAKNGRSMEAEAREMISAPITKSQSRSRNGLGTAVHKRFAALGGVDLQIPPRAVAKRSVGELTQGASRDSEPRKGLGTAIHTLFAPLGGVELQIPTRRKSHRPTPTFK
jgi:plasmid stability protein